MRVLIENYKGWDIFFDTESEDFYTISDKYDTDKKKKSFASTKKHIDDYIKENEKFVKVKVVKLDSIYDTKNSITLIGFRKDGAFMYEDHNGVKSQLSKYSEIDYFLDNEENEKHIKRIIEINNEIDVLQNKKKDVSRMLIKVSVKDLRTTMYSEILSTL